MWGASFDRLRRAPASPVPAKTRSVDGHLEYWCERHQHWTPAQSRYLKRVLVVDTFGESEELCFSEGEDGPWTPCRGDGAREIT